MGRALQLRDALLPPAALQQPAREGAQDRRAVLQGGGVKGHIRPVQAAPHPRPQPDIHGGDARQGAVEVEDRKSVV